MKDEQQNKPEPLTGLKDLLKVGRDIITDEGVEERIVNIHAMVTTITGGGKYRVHAVANSTITDLGCANTSAEAEKDIVSKALMLGGIAMCDPARAFELLRKAAQSK